MYNTFLTNGADVYMHNNDGTSLLFIAWEKTIYFRTVQHVLTNGAKVNFYKQIMEAVLYKQNQLVLCSKHVKRDNFALYNFYEKGRKFQNYKKN